MTGPAIDWSAVFDEIEANLCDACRGYLDDPPDPECTLPDRHHPDPPLTAAEIAGFLALPGLPRTQTTERTSK